MKRRQIVSGLAAAALLPAMAPAAADSGPLTLLIAGPDGQQTSRWGDACALAISDCYPGSPNIVGQPVGGWDGVTGANRLDALVVPDGKTAAILPGDALIAYLVGDSRVHFDPTRWTPLLAGCNSGVLMLRPPKGSAPSLQSLRDATLPSLRDTTLQSLRDTTLRSLRDMAPIRLGIDQPQSRDLAALLAFARLGVETLPVFGLRSSEAKTQAFIDNSVDAVFICGEGVPEDITPLLASGAVPAFSIGAPDEAGMIGPDPLFPALSLADGLGPSLSPQLDAAYQAAAAAARMDFLLVLPRLTGPDQVALWSQAAQNAAAQPALAAAAAASAVTLQPAPVLAGALGQLGSEAPEQGSLQAFLARTYGWQPG